MGHYTRLKLDVQLQGDLPADVLAILQAMVAGNSHEFATPLPAHPLFACRNWDVIGYGAHSVFDDVIAPPHLQRAGEGGATCWFLQMHFALKNYDNEIQQFLNWLGPYLACEPGTLVGEWQTEEAWLDEEMGDLARRPTLLVAQAAGFVELVCERASHQAAQLLEGDAITEQGQAELAVAQPQGRARG